MTISLTAMIKPLAFEIMPNIIPLFQEWTILRYGSKFNQGAQLSPAGNKDRTAILVAWSIQTTIPATISK
jgi:hypothetical protein